MKRLTGILAAAVFMVFACQQAGAQNYKFAHINTDDLIRAMPEYDSAMAKLEKTRKELINALEIMQVELNNKYEAYNKESKNLNELVRQAREQDITDMQQKIQEFQVNAQASLQEEQTKLTQPIFAKIDKAIKDAGKEGGYIYVFDTKGQLLYFDDTKSTNLLAAVKAKLGVK